MATFPAVWQDTGLDISMNDLMPTETRRPRLVLDFVHHNPGEEPVRSQFLDPAYLKALGYTGQVLNSHVQAAVAQDRICPELPPSGDAQRQWTAQLTESIRRRIRETKAAGLACYAWTDFVVLPRELVRKYRDRIVAGRPRSYVEDVKGEFTPDIHAPLVQDLLCAQIDGIFELFPDLDGLVIRVGETYLHGLPYHTGGDPISRGVASHEEMIRLLKESVCEKHGKTVIYRTWLSGIDEEVGPYLDVCDRIEPHPGLIFSIKHCTGDFHRTHPFSPPLGQGRHPQIVEVQCQREYEGKGAYPNYIAQAVIEGFEEYDAVMPGGTRRGLKDLLDCGNFAGIWTWSRGGGWKGPYIEHEFWCALNAFVLVQWARHSNGDPNRWIETFAREHGFTEEDAVTLDAICERSCRAVLRGAASMQGGIDTLWTRDHYIGGIEDANSPMARSVEQVLGDDRVEEVLAEREEAVRLWQAIEGLAATLRGGSDELRSFLRTSCTYGRICYEVFAAGWTLLLLGRMGEERNRYDGKRMAQALARYDAAWKAWQELKDTAPSCPTLYRDTYCRYVRDQGMFPATGIGDSVQRYRKLLSETSSVAMNSGD